MRSLDDRLASFAEAWKPEPGDKLIGVVVDLDERDSAYGDEPYPIVTVETDDGSELALHAFHTVARNELAKQRPVVGDRIGIAYYGMKDGKSYESYRVIVEKAESEPKTIDWDKHVTPDEDEQDLDPEADDELDEAAPDAETGLSDRVPF
jgi:hypothetical protein